MTEYPTAPTSESQPAPAESTGADEAQDDLAFDDLADVEFLLEGIEDKIAPLALA